MKIKKAIFNYRRDIRTIPRKELIKNLENIRDNYLNVLPYYKEHFRMEFFNARGIGELDIRAKLNTYIKKLKKRKLSKSDSFHLRYYLEQAKKVVPGSERKFKTLINQETRYEWDEYVKFAESRTRGTKAYLEDIVKRLELTDDDLRRFLNSNRNVDLSHVTWDSDGLWDFIEEYEIDVQTARLVDFFGYDYAEYGKTGALVPRKSE